MSGTRLPLLMLLAACACCTAAAVVIQNGAPCLEGKVATSSSDIQKDDWACFVLCSDSDGPRARASGRRSGVCRRCCLDPGQAVDTGAGAESTPSSGSAPASTGETGAGEPSTKEEASTSTAAAEASSASA